MNPIESKIIHEIEKKCLLAIPYILKFLAEKYGAEAIGSKLSTLHEGITALKKRI